MRREREDLLGAHVHCKRGSAQTARNASIVHSSDSALGYPHLWMKRLLHDPNPHGNGLSVPPQLHDKNRKRRGESLPFVPVDALVPDQIRPAEERFTAPVRRVFAHVRLGLFDVAARDEVGDVHLS